MHMNLLPINIVSSLNRQTHVFLHPHDKVERARRGMSCEQNGTAHLTEAIVESNDVDWLFYSKSILRQ
jgi:hypothetical protein